MSICLAASVIQGLVKGFTDQIIALVSIILGTWAAFKFSDLVCGWAGPYLHMSGQVLHVIVFILMIIAVIVVMHLLGKVIKTSIKFVMLGWLDTPLRVATNFVWNLLVSATGFIEAILRAVL